MGLKLVVEKLEDVPENFRNLYKADNGKFVMDIEGAVPKERLDEFRTNNIQLQQQLDRLKDVDPAKYRELMDLDRRFKEKQLIEAGKVDEVVNLRVGAMKEELEGRLNSTTTELSKANQQLSVLMIDNAVKTAALKAGVLPTALDDVVLRARGVYQMDKGQPVPKNDKGEVIYGKDGTTPMATDEWIVNLKKIAPHLFQGSQGSGAGGGRGAPGTDLSKLTPAQKISLGLNSGALVAKLPGEA